MLYLFSKYCFMIIISLDYCNSWNIWVSSNEPKVNPPFNSNLNANKRLGSSDSISNSLMRSNEVSENLNIDESSYDSTTLRPAKHYTSVKTPSTDSWVDLAVSLSKLAYPYFPEQMRSLDVDWTQATSILRIFERSIPAVVGGEDSITKIARQYLPLAVPVMFDATRKVVDIILQMVETSEAHSVTRRSTPMKEEVVENVMKSLESIIHFTTGFDVMSYRNLDDL